MCQQGRGKALVLLTLKLLIARLSLRAASSYYRTLLLTSLDFLCASAKQLLDFRNMELATERIRTIGRHLGVGGLQPALLGSSELQALQRLLEHDNWDCREQLKNLMKDPLFTP